MQRAEQKSCEMREKEKKGKKKRNHENPETKAYFLGFMVL